MRGRAAVGNEEQEEAAQEKLGFLRIAFVNLTSRERRYSVGSD
jgi:hypothetical protein